MITNPGVLLIVEVHETVIFIWDLQISDIGHVCLFIVTFKINFACQWITYFKISKKGLQFFSLVILYLDNNKNQKQIFIITWLLIFIIHSVKITVIMPHIDNVVYINLFRTLCIIYYFSICKKILTLDEIYDPLFYFPFSFYIFNVFCVTSK